MIHLKKLRGLKLDSAITSIGNEADRDNVETWGKYFPNVVVSGPVEPIKANGVRYYKSQKLSSVRHAIGICLARLPGNAVFMISEPNVAMVGSCDGIIEHIQDSGFDLAWGGFVTIDEKPSVFLFSVPLAGHLMLALNDSVVFGSPWQAEVHNRLQTMVRHRYFDVTSYGAFASPPKPEVVKLEKTKAAVREVKKKK